MSSSTDSSININQNELSDDDHKVSQSIMILLMTFMLHFLICSLVRKTPLKKFLPEPSIAIIVSVLIGIILFNSLRHVVEILADFNDNLFMILILPPIIFSTAFNIDAHSFGRNVFSIFTYAVFGTLTASIITFTMTKIYQNSFTLDMTDMDIAAFSALISATDPVSVIALFSVIKVDRTLSIIIVGESLLNDAVSIVLYSVLEKIREENNFTVSTFFLTLGNFTWVFTGSILLGIFAGLFISWCMYKMSDNPSKMKILLGLVSPYVCYILAESMYLSGIVALLFCGIIMAIYTKPNLTKHELHLNTELYEIIAYIFETYVFLVIGFNFSTSFTEIREFDFWFLFWTCFTLIISRFVQVVFFSWILNRNRENIKIRKEFQMMMVLSGLRGAVAYALSIETTGFKHHETIQTLTYLITVISILVIGFFLESYVDNVDITDNNDGLHFVHDSSGKHSSTIKYWIYNEIHKNILVPRLLNGTNAVRQSETEYIINKPDDIDEEIGEIKRRISVNGNDKDRANNRSRTMQMQMQMQMKRGEGNILKENNEKHNANLSREYDLKYDNEYEIRANDDDDHDHGADIDRHNFDRVV